MEVICELPGIYGSKESLHGKEHLSNELVMWLRSKGLSVRQAKDLLTVTENLISEAWRTEERSEERRVGKECM